MGYLPKEKIKKCCWPGVGEQTMGGHWGQPADVALQSGCFSFISSNRPAKVDKGFKKTTTKIGQEDGEFCKALLFHAHKYSGSDPARC